MRRGRTFAALTTVLIAGSLLLARQPVHAQHAMVVAQEPRAAEVGVDVLKSGGNAIDAAVAVGFALAVTHPSAGNIGGGGFMLIRLADGTSTFIDFREKAPGKASHNMYLDAAGKVIAGASTLGMKAAGVPGTVRGFEYAHKKFGHKPWAELLNPAVTLASDGFTIAYPLANSLNAAKLQLSQFPESARIFVNGGQGFHFGDQFRQPELAATLKRIGQQGASDFYEGETARMLASFEQSQGGLITLSDLKNYQAVERKVLTGKYKEYDVITAPPPSSGGIGLLQMMGMLTDSGYENSGAGSAASIHFAAETMRRFYADRSEFLGDPDFYQVPVPALLNKDYIAARRNSIDRDHASNSNKIGAGHLPSHESSETTHFSVLDAEGNAVAVTYTLNGGYGSAVTVPGAGFLLNNEMDDFAAKPGDSNMFGLVQGESNSIQPNKRPLSSMTPTILLRDGKLFMVLGAPGGSRIITGVLEVILNVVDFGMNLQEAIDAPRFHHQWKPDVLYTEKGISPDTIALLKAKGHKVETNTFGVGQVEAILCGPDGLQGAYDGRGDGKAAGY